MDYEKNSKNNKIKIKIVQSAINKYEDKLQTKNLDEKTIEKYQELIKQEKINLNKLILEFSEECL